MAISYARNSLTGHLLPAIACLVFFSVPVDATKLYKWVDEEGNIRYSDRLPVDQAKQKHHTLTPDGRVLETKEAAISPEQRKRERAERKRLEEEARRQAELAARQKAIQDHHDNVLLMTFSNESEILEAKDERVAVIESVIKLLRKNIKNEQAKLDRLEQRAYQQYIEKDLVVPGGLAQNIEYFSEKILNIQQQLALKLDERDRVKQQYANDLLRYRELTQAQQAAEARKNQPPAPPGLLNY
ncbi:MAG: DUF4124 domain-containing protein [Gammaproteobacteria bacterium]|nr:DUF4124 domain-containing protein [Gammaproteobacteria bacterium]